MRSTRYGANWGEVRIARRQRVGVLTITNLISETVCRLNQLLQPRVLRYWFPRSRKTSSSVEGTVRLVTTVNLTLKLMHHMSSFGGLLLAWPVVGGALGEFDVAPKAPDSDTAGSVGGEFDVETLVRVAVVVGIGLLAVGEVPLVQLIHWLYCVLRSVEIVVESTLPQAYSLAVKNNAPS